jgi:hypothetical protein
MKTSILAAALFLSLSVNAEAATTFKSIVDVSQASNHANIPTEIDAGGLRPGLRPRTWTVSL